VRKVVILDGSDLRVYEDASYLRHANALDFRRVLFRCLMRPQHFPYYTRRLILKARPFVLRTPTSCLNALTSVWNVARFDPRRNQHRGSKNNWEESVVSSIMAHLHSCRILAVNRYRNSSCRGRSRTFTLRDSWSKPTKASRTQRCNTPV